MGGPWEEEPAMGSKTSSEAWDSRPARKQAERLPDEESFGDYNIWYHKRKGSRGPPRPAASRCCIRADAGCTKGSACGASQFCVHFARGCCVRGRSCTYLHRLPELADDQRLEASVDIFGRDRHSTDRSDLGGVGNFSREQRTLYVGGLVASAALQAAVREAFGEWGAIESTKVLPAKACAFVKYRFRANAEFAREAMMNQSMGRHAKQLNIRWATSDPNPGVRKRERRRVEHTVVAAAVGAGVLPPSSMAVAHCADQALLQQAAARGPQRSAAFSMLPPDAAVTRKRPRQEYDRDFHEKQQKQSAPSSAVPNAPTLLLNGAVFTLPPMPAAQTQAVAPATSPPAHSALGMLSAYDSDSDE